MKLILLILPLVILASSLDSLGAPARKPRILIISAEESGWFKTGGLGNMVAEWRDAWEKKGYDVQTAIPGYEKIFADPQLSARLTDSGQEYTAELNREHPNRPKFRVYADRENGKTKRLVFRPTESDPNLRYFYNPNGGYGDPAREAEAFGAWSQATAKYALDQGYDLVIVNDWHTGAVAPYLKKFSRERGRKPPKIWGVIHNAGYQKVVDASVAKLLGLQEFFTHKNAEFHGQFNFLKALMTNSDFVTTVSHQHANELLTPTFANGLEGVAQELKDQNRFSGKANPIDPSAWDPKNLDQFLKANANHFPATVAAKLAKKNLKQFNFSVDDFSGKLRGKALLQEAFGLPIDPKVPLIGFTSRLDYQKGTDYVVQAIKRVVENRKALGKPVQFVMIGDGTPEYSKLVEALQKDPSMKGHFAAQKFNGPLEHLITAYADVVSNPSRYEPCGQNYQYAAADGTPALVSNVGGHSDLVHANQNGFLFEMVGQAKPGSDDFVKTEHNLYSKINNVLDVIGNHPDRFLKMKKAAMNSVNSWENGMKGYMEIADFILSDGPENLSRRGIHFTGVPTVDALQAQNSRILFENCAKTNLLQAN